MKTKLFISSLSVLLLGGIITANVLRTETQVSELALANIEALASEESGLPGSKCYATYHGCWFWNCYNIFHCTSGCPVVRSDDYKDESQCG